MKRKIVILGFTIISIILLIIIFFEVVRPRMFIIRDFGVDLNECEKILSNLEEKDIIKILETDDKIVYITTPDEYKEKVEHIVKKLDGKDLYQEGSHIFFKNNLGETKTIEWKYTKYYNKFIIYK